MTAKCVLISLAMSLPLICRGAEFNFISGYLTTHCFLNVESFAEVDVWSAQQQQYVYFSDLDVGQDTNFPNGQMPPTDTYTAHATVIFPPTSAEAQEVANITYTPTEDKIHAAVQIKHKAILSGPDKLAACESSEGGRQACTVGPNFAVGPSGYTLKSTMQVGSVKAVPQSMPPDHIYAEAKSRFGFTYVTYEPVDNEWKVTYRYKNSAGTWINGSKTYPAEQVFTHSTPVSLEPMSAGQTFQVRCIATAWNDYKLTAPVAGSLETDMIVFGRVTLSH